MIERLVDILTSRRYLIAMTYVFAHVTGMAWSATHIADAWLDVLVGLVCSVGFGFVVWLVAFYAGARLR